MNFQQEKFVRFQDWTAEKNVEPLYSPDDDLPPGKFRRTINSVSVKFQRSLESGSERIKTSWKSYLIDSVVGNSFEMTGWDGTEWRRRLRGYNSVFHGCGTSRSRGVRQNENSPKPRPVEQRVPPVLGAPNVGRNASSYSVPFRPTYQRALVWTGRWR